MRLRTLPLSLAGVLLGCKLALAEWQVKPLVVVLVCLTTVCLQILSNLSNELGDVLRGTDTSDRQGPAYGLNSGVLTVEQMRRLIRVFVALCCAFGAAMVWVSYGTFFCWPAMGCWCWAHAPSGPRCTTPWAAIPTATGGLEISSYSSFSGW